jgi:hypothetical protein
MSFRNYFLITTHVQPKCGPPSKPDAAEDPLESESSVVVTTVAAIGINGTGRAGNRVEIRALGTESNVSPVSPSTVLKTHAVDTTDLVPQVIKVPVQPALDRVLFSRRLAISVRGGVKREGDAVD